MIKNIVGSFLIFTGKCLCSMGESIIHIGHKTGTKRKMGKMEILEGHLANKIALFGIRLMWYGNVVVAKGVFMSPKHGEAECKIDAPKHKGSVMWATDEEKDAVISCYVKKGGCEVQTGSFRRIDCK